MRALTLALNTYSLRKKIFIKLITKEMMEEGYFLTSLRDQWAEYNIDLNSIKKNINEKPDLEKNEKNLFVRQ